MAAATTGINTYKIRQGLVARCLIAVLCVLVSIAAAGQEKKYTLKGTARVKDGDSYPYQAVFTVSGGKVKGVSVTIQPDGTELRANIKGHLLKKKHLLAFTEVSPVGEQPKDQATCLFDVVLAYKPHNGKYVFNGLFTGKDSEGKPCGAGLMQFEQPDFEGSAFRDDTVKREKMAVKDTVATGAAGNKITEGVDKQIAWNSDKCLVEVWDGGVIDGDVVTIKLNGKDVLTDHTLTRQKTQVWLRLQEKVNTITIVAGDEGAAPPNTAQMMLTDGNEQYKITAFNKKGKTANVILIRK